MIVFIKGILVSKMPTSAEVEVNGIGYGINIPISTYDRLPEEGKEITLSTYHYVREDTLALYGFYSKAEREMFATLLKVSGIGPKVAIAILSTLTETQIHNAIINEDISTISSVPGIGKKTAERLIVELKDKVRKRPLSKTKEAGKHAELSKEDLIFDDAVSALITLGYGSQESRRAVTKAVHENKVSSLENAIREGLKILKKK